MKRPWLVLFLYVFTITLDWLYAYFVEIQPDIINNAWSVLFPLLSFFYIEFSLLAIVGIYSKTKWGFGLGYITLTCGAILTAMSYLFGYKSYPEILHYLILILSINLVVTLYMIFYAQSKCRLS